MNKKDDLENLVAQAESQLESHASSEESGSSIHQGVKKNLKISYLNFLPLILFAITYFIYINIHKPLPNTIETEANLIHLVTQARDSIELNTVDGNYPPVLPNAALGAVVNYRVSSTGYFLSAHLNNVIVEMDANGKITTYGVSQ